MVRANSKRKLVPLPNTVYQDPSSFNCGCAVQHLNPEPREDLWLGGECRLRRFTALWKKLGLKGVGQMKSLLAFLPVHQDATRNPVYVVIRVIFFLR